MPFRPSILAAALVLAGCASADRPSSFVPPEARANPAAWPQAASPAAVSSPETEAAIDAILAQMTIEQKVGQIIQGDISSVKPSDLARYPLGSVLAGGNSGPYGDERSSAQAWRKLVSEYREASRRAGAQIPILFGVDAVHGHSNLPGATIFPHNIGLGAARDPDLLKRIGAATAMEIAASGIEWTFAPTLAVPQDLRWGRTYEGYGSTPALVAAYARAMTLGLQGELVVGQPLDSREVAATAKHFLADGGTADGRDQGDAQISERDLVALHAQGYPAAIDAGALTVMASFSSWNGVKHHGNASLLTDVLKNRLGFAGFVVGDWNGHGQIPGCSVTDCPTAINAGLDMFMAPDSWKGLYQSTVKSVRAGDIPVARLDDAVRRILRVKFKLGLMGDAPIARGNPSDIGSAAHLALAREAVSKSLVLLKNNGGVLPIRNGARVLIAGQGADAMAMQSGGWTISWQGTDTRAEDFPNGQTIGRAIAEAVQAQGGQATIAVDGASAGAAKPDVAVVVLGERPYAEFEGDVPNLAFASPSGEEKLIASLKAQGVKVVVVFLSGRPMFVGALLNQADAFVAAWLPGTQGAGVADVLVAGAGNIAARDFQGRLPFAWPADARADLSSPLFPVGYGLDYTQRTEVAAVNEDPRMDISSTAHHTSYVVRGKTPAPWRLAMDGSVSTRAVDISMQEDARQFSWLAAGAITIVGPEVDLTLRLNGNEALVLDWRIDNQTSKPAQLTFGGATIGLDQIVGADAVGAPARSVVPLRCFAAAGAKLDRVSVPFQLQAAKGFAATIRTVRIEPVGAEQPCPDIQVR